MRGSVKPLYLQIRKKGIATVSPSLANQTLRADGPGIGWTGGNTGSFSKQPNPGRAKRWRTHVVIHSCNTPSCECGARRQTRGGGTQISGSEASILCIYCPHTMQIPVPTLPKNSIGGLHGIQETTTLLTRVSNHGSL